MLLFFIKNMLFGNQQWNYVHSLNLSRFSVCLYKFITEQIWYLYHTIKLGQTVIFIFYCNWSKCKFYLHIQKFCLETTSLSLMPIDCNSCSKLANWLNSNYLLKRDGKYCKWINKQANYVIIFCPRIRPDNLF